MHKKIISILIFLSIVISGLSIPKLAYGCGGPGDPEGVCWIELNPDTWVPTCDCGGGGANPYAPDINGTVRDSFGNRVPNVEIDWTDSNGHLRKRWTDANGYYSYPSWVLDCNGYPWPDNPYFTAMHNNEYGSYPNAPWWSNTNEFSAYSQIQNPHTIAPKKPSNWYGAFVPNSRATNFDLLVEPVCSPAWTRDFTYKPQPYAYINGPSSGYVGQAYNFTATGNGPGMGLIQIYWSYADHGLNLSQGSSWNLLNQTGCDGSSACTLWTASFTPPTAGTYWLGVNAHANFSPPNTSCYGNPLQDSGQLTGMGDCNAGYSFHDNILFTASPCPAAVACPTACGSPASNQPNGACGTYYCPPVTPAAAQLCPTTCHTADVGVPNGACGTTNCTANCPTAPTVSINPPACINTGDTGSSIGISWGTVVPAVNTIDISTDSNFGTWSWKSVVGLSNTNATGFSGGLTFNPSPARYYVRSWNGLFHSTTNSNFSIPVCSSGSASVLTATCPSPGTAATLSWTPAAYATYYKIQLNGPSPDFTPPPGMNPVTITRTTTSSTPYNWSVQACNADNCGAVVPGPSFTCGASAWFKTTGGDIHSNVEINAPSGP